MGLFDDSMQRAAKNAAVLYLTMVEVLALSAQRLKVIVEERIRSEKNERTACDEKNERTAFRFRWSVVLAC